MKFYNCKKRGGKGLAILKRGTNSSGVVLTRELEVSATLKWEFPPFKKGRGVNTKSLTLSYVKG